MIKKILIAIGIMPPQPCAGMTIKDGARQISGEEKSEFEYLWNFYQGYKRNPAAPLTIMAKWEREAIKRGAR